MKTVEKEGGLDKSLYLFCETRAEKISWKERRRKSRQKGKEWLFSLSINLPIIIIIIIIITIYLS